MTLEETIRTLEAVALQQQSVAMVIDNDIFKLNTIPNAKYAVFAYTQGEHLTSVSGDLATYRLTLFYVDRLLADKSNQTQIQSTGTQVLRNILTMMSELDFQVDNMPIQPFTQQFVDECAGVYCAVSIGAANGCECMPGFTEVLRKLNAATDKANDAAKSAQHVVDTYDDVINTLAHSDCTLDERVEALERALISVLSGAVVIPKLQVNELGVWGDNNLAPVGDGAPTKAPDRAGQFYIDKTARALYFSTGNMAVSDWKIQ